ncbi:hypothetical protein [Agarilytica rhodophyticola]|uniref:hypothetical protein n=1 Tax=Agarilytica rhodophyticola TaxID=1737490 RepID=UPI000B3454DF|nr:hypothetical protein [Agarilytica rhodophyticola]
MKKWIISLSISFVITTAGLIYFVSFVVQDQCLAAGGRWLGTFEGCQGGNGYSTDYLSSPLAIGIYLAIVVAIASAFVQFYSIAAKLFKLS